VAHLSRSAGQDDQPQGEPPSLAAPSQHARHRAMPEQGGAAPKPRSKTEYAKPKTSPGRWRWCRAAADQHVHHRQVFGLHIRVRSRLRPRHRPCSGICSMTGAGWVLPAMALAWGWSSVGAAAQVRHKI